MRDNSDSYLGLSSAEISNLNDDTSMTFLHQNSAFVVNLNALPCSFEYTYFIYLMCTNKDFCK